MIRHLGDESFQSTKATGILWESSTHHCQQMQVACSCLQSHHYWIFQEGSLCRLCRVVRTNNHLPLDFRADEPRIEGVLFFPLKETTSSWITRGRRLRRIWKCVCSVGAQSTSGCEVCKNRRTTDTILKLHNLTMKSAHPDWLITLEPFAYGCTLTNP